MLASKAAAVAADEGRPFLVVDVPLDVDGCESCELRPYGFCCIAALRADDDDEERCLELLLPGDSLVDICLGDGGGGV